MISRGQKVKYKCQLVDACKPIPTIPLYASLLVNWSFYSCSYLQQIDFIFSFCPSSMENQNDRTEKTNMEHLLYYSIFFLWERGLKFHKIIFLKDMLAPSFIRQSRSSYLVGQSTPTLFSRNLAQGLSHMPSSTLATSYGLN